MSGTFGVLKLVDIDPAMFGLTTTLAVEFEACSRTDVIVPVTLQRAIDAVGSRVEAAVATSRIASFFI